MILVPNPVRRLVGLEPVYGGRARSSKWPALRQRWLKEHPACEATGLTVDVVVHHIMPYHEFPELELEWDNLATLTEYKTLNAHLWIGHLGRWDDWNPHVRMDAIAFREMLTMRRRKAA